MLRSSALIALFFPLFLFLTPGLNAQPPRFLSYQYIDEHAEEAIHQMVLYKIPASVILAQAIFESHAGRSELAKRSNNHFGIKCHVQWSGDTVVKHDDMSNECFRRYESIEESYTDHSLFIVTRRWYAPLFKLPLTDYKSWCHGLKQAGYATYPGYAEELIRIIERTKLYELDRAVKLQPKSITLQNAEIEHSNYQARYFTLKDYAKSGLLFLDEDGIHLRSLDVIVEKPEELGDYVAGGR